MSASNVTTPITAEDVAAVRELCRMASEARAYELQMRRCDFHQHMRRMRAHAGKLAAWCDEKEAELAVAERGSMAAPSCSSKVEEESTARADYRPFCDLCGRGPSPLAGRG